MARILKNGVEYGVGGQTLTDRITSYTNERAKLCLRGLCQNQTTSAGYTNKILSLTETKSVDNSLISIQGTKLVAQKRGNYLVSVSCAWNSNATNKHLFCGVTQDGGNWLGALNSAYGWFPPGNYTPLQTNTQALFIEKGHYIEPVIQSNVSGATAVEYRITIVYVGGEK